MKILSKIKQISKAYTEGIYADTPANRKLGRVGMSYAEYSKKLKDDKEEKADRKYWLIQFDSGEEDIFTEDKMSKEKLVEEACKFAKEIAEANNYDEYKFDIQENTNDWEEEDFDKKQYDWLSIKAKKHNGKYEISVYDWRTHEYIRNDRQKREEKNLQQKIERDKEKLDKEFQERFGWMEEFLNYQNNKEKINIPNKVYHKAPPTLRENILKEGLKPQVGPSYSAHWEEKEEELIPVIFAYDKDKKEYDSTYDDDIYEIDTSKLDKESWNKDKDEYMYNTFGSIVYNKEIPKDAIKLIYRGTGNPTD